MRTLDRSMAEEDGSPQYLQESRESVTLHVPSTLVPEPRISGGGEGGAHELSWPVLQQRARVLSYGNASVPVRAESFAEFAIALPRYRMVCGSEHPEVSEQTWSRSRATLVVLLCIPYHQEASPSKLLCPRPACDSAHRPASYLQ